MHLFFFFLLVFDFAFLQILSIFIDRFSNILQTILLNLKALKRFILRLKFICLLFLTLLLQLFELFIFFNELIKLYSQTLSVPAIQCLFCCDNSHWPLRYLAVIVFYKMLFWLNRHVSLDEILVLCKVYV
jgi:hypothetical protein